VGNAQFTYRRNPNGTVDSICLNCFLTAATAKWEGELHEMEFLHRCELELKIRFFEPVKMTSAR
jgi:hypothetical protein